MKAYDVIVVGSGPAGSAAAATAAKAGLSTLIIDKARFPRDKLCGGLFTGRSEAAFKEIFESEITPDLFLTSTHMRFSSGPDTLAEIANAPPMYLTMRRDLDRFLHERAVQFGADTALGAPVTEIDATAKTITTRDRITHRFKVLIGADGVSSNVARSLFGAPFDPAKTALGLEIEAPLQPRRDDAVEIDFDAADWGYGWSFPKQRSLTIGICGITTENADMKGRMTEYIHQLGAQDPGKYKGHYLPFGDYKKHPGKGAILLAGDAAGLVDPITGEGIALAMESGAFAAQAALLAIQEGRPDQAMQHYLPLIKPIHHSLDQARMWRLIMFPKATREYFKKAFARGSHLQMTYLELLAGRAGYADLKWELLRRMPKLAWRMARHRLGLQPRG